MTREQRLQFDPIAPWARSAPSLDAGGAEADGDTGPGDARYSGRTHSTGGDPRRAVGGSSNRAEESSEARKSSGVGASRGRTTPGNPSSGSLPVLPLVTEPPPRLDDDPAGPLRAATLASEAEELPRWWHRLVGRETNSFLVSLLFHMALLLALGLWVVHRPAGAPHGSLLAAFDEPVRLESLVALTPREARIERASEVAGRALETPQTIDVPRVADLAAAEAAPPRVRTPIADAASGSAVDWLMASDAEVTGALRGRGDAAQEELLRRHGGTQGSQRAVDRGLRWLQAHQRRDGSWNFNHHLGPCQGMCSHPGDEASTTAATGMALLPFLGRGHTHRDGEYAEVVRRGLYYLGTRALATTEGANLQEGTMYGQGLATIALCEAYVMTGDPALKDLAQAAIDYIVYAQDAKGGGWRYSPGEPGDTTVTGWQLMALKSGQMGRLHVPSPSIFLVRRFLDSVQTEYGARYGYMTPQPRRSTTAIGLLLRMYTGWQRDNPGLVRGVSYLSQWGPSDNDLYYNYYATQVMHHFGGAAWESWNPSMRDHLIATQADAGHEAGSWYFDEPRTRSGGRLYNTAMAVMILEVYYRYMPLYTTRATEEGF
jgi:hypothetical protein